MSGDSQWVCSLDEWNDQLKAKNITQEQDRKYRYKSSGMLRSFGMSLKLPQFTIATGQVFLHRYFYRNSFNTLKNLTEFVMTVIFLASKVEEHPRKLRDIIFVAKNNLPPAVFVDQSKPNSEYLKLKHRILEMEKYVLEALCFDLTIEHPYKFVFKFIKELGEDVDDELVQSVWNVVNDSFRSNICLIYTPCQVATGAIVYACIIKNINVPYKQHKEDQILFGVKKMIIDAILKEFNILFDKQKETVAK